MSDEITRLQDKLRFGASQLSELLQDLERESARLPYDWETQERLRSNSFFSKSVERAVTLALHDPVASMDTACLRELDDKVLCVGQLICASMLSILTQLSANRERIDPVIRGSWSMDTQLPVDEAVRIRLSTLLQSVGSCMKHILQMRSPDLHPWKEPKTAQVIAILADTAKALESELIGLISGKGATVLYGRYLQLETILSSYEYFEAYALNRNGAH